MAIETLFILAFIAGGSGPQKPDHRLRCIMERTSRSVEGKFDGQGAAAAHSGLQVWGCAGSAWGQLDGRPKRSLDCD